MINIQFFVKTEKVIATTAAVIQEIHTIIFPRIPHIDRVSMMNHRFAKCQLGRIAAKTVMMCWGRVVTAANAIDPKEIRTAVSPRMNPMIVRLPVQMAKIKDMKMYERKRWSLSNVLCEAGPSVTSALPTSVLLVSEPTKDGG